MHRHTICLETSIQLVKAMRRDGLKALVIISARNRGKYLVRKKPRPAGEESDADVVPAHSLFCHVFTGAAGSLGRTD
jgi:hypothetical protein